MPASDRTACMSGRRGHFGLVDPEDILIELDHPHGRVAVTLREWMDVGPGTRPLLRPTVVLPRSVIPFRYRNTRLTRALIRLGWLRDPWSDPS